MNYNVGATVTVNGRSYRFPKAPTVCVCIDGSEPGYIEKAVARGLAPNFEKLMREGTSVLAHSVIPSFTNPNNLSIATGRPPSVHGICGNYLYNPATGAFEGTPAIGTAGAYAVQVRATDANGYDITAGPYALTVNLAALALQQEQSLPSTSTVYPTR